MSDFVINELLTEKPVEETIKIYSKIADNFSEVVKGSEYFFPQIIVKEFSKLNLPRDIKILDVAAGTGNVGKLLHDLGYTNIDALDGCKEMLNHAKKMNGVYKNFIISLVKADSKLPIEDNEYDSALISGATCPAHIDVDAYKEIIRIVKPGGIIGWIKEDDAILGRNSERYRNGFYQKSLKQYDNKWVPINGYDPKVIPNATLGKPGDVYFFKVL
ncbi:malonyl-[acyl-carrier protein] O-methyltransferase-like protein [Dinothrombium tinctorium]|uniref:Malonyl-[acyl-carrier protein] O-methyltransferase-like protein n=1 Tax=Dinothrombium tinctorium TaxID=1965070 RepID=A0A3S3SNQ7_9ACAR|nr:malonyl-[acyl-carrier protein] O-methyltransferase-like protein [Dinothrombium tinctorium]